MELLERVEHITMWKAGDKRAPHKPLLLLLTISIYLRQNFTNRLLPFTDLEKSLKDLLKTFHNSGRNPHYPFWRLRQDNIWEVQSDTALHQNESGDVRITDLRNYNAHGGFKELYFNELKSSDRLTSKLIDYLIQENFPATLHDDLLEHLNLDQFHLYGHKRVNNRDHTFRDKILNIYNNECAICGYSIRLKNTLVGVEAAHIKWKQAKGPDTEENGIALCSIHHKLFDYGAFTIQPDYRIEVAKSVRKNSSSDLYLVKYDRQRLKTPATTKDFPNIEYCSWHLNEVFKPS